MGCNGINEGKNTPKSKLCKFGYVDYIVLASTIAIAIAEDFNSNDLNILAAFLATLSDEIALIAAVESCPLNDDDKDIFVPPAVDVAITSSSLSKKTKIIRKRTVIKKIKNRKNR
jgi:hypothetical protein